MTTIERFVVSGTTDVDVIHAAAQRLYDAETALHAARQSHVDSWIAAAYDRLHDTLEDYRSATCSAGW